MKTEALLLLVFCLGIISAEWIILCLNFIIDEEKKGKGRFFNIIIKIGLFKEKSPSVIFLLTMLLLSIVGLIWAIITLSSIYTSLDIICVSIITLLLIILILCIMRKIKKS